MTEKRKAARGRGKTAAAASIVRQRLEPRHVKALAKKAAGKECDDRCALSAWHAWRSQHLTPSYNWMIDFQVPAGKRLVIELVTAMVEVPAGESARLRMYTSLGSSPSNLDLFLTPQGVRNGNTAVWVATHSLRAYTDSLLEFDVNRDNPWTEGETLICVSGYLVTP